MDEAGNPSSNTPTTSSVGHGLVEEDGTEALRLRGARVDWSD